MQAHHLLLLVSAVLLLFIMAQQSERHYSWRFMAALTHSQSLKDCLGSAPSARAPFAVVDFDNDGIDGSYGCDLWTLASIEDVSMVELDQQAREARYAPITSNDGDEAPLEESGEVLRVIRLGVNAGESRIVAVTNGLDVMVLDKELNLKWRVKLPQPKLWRKLKPIRGRRRRERLTLDVSLAPGAPALWNGDKGSVIVSVSVQLSEAKWRTWKHEEEFKRSQAEYEDEPQVQDDEDASLLQKHHVSYYALDSTTGELRWSRQNAGEEEENPEIIEALNKSSANVEREHLWKIDAALESGHFEQSVWHNFRHSWMSVLPHSWYSLEDTSMQLAHFSRQRHTRGNSPNVIAAHSVNGIEAVHLYTGRALTSLALRPFALYADIDSDGTIEQLWASGCRLLYGVGVPHLRTLAFNASLCEHSAPGQAIGNSNLLLVAADSAEDKWLGVDSNSPMYRVIHLLSDGVMSGIPIGNSAADAAVHVWHTQTPASWNPENITQRGQILTVAVDGESGNNILGVASDLVLVTANGELLASTSLSDQVESVVIGRFTSHHPSLEVILVTQNQLQLFSLEPVGVPTGVLLVVLVGIVLLIINKLKSFVLMPSTPSAKDE